MFKTLDGLYAGLAGIFLISLYYYTYWKRYRAEVPKAADVNELPPKDISPAGLRHIYTNGFDLSTRSIISLITSMAIKGYLTVSEESKIITLKKTGRLDDILSESEKIADNLLFKAKNSVTLTRESDFASANLIKEFWTHYNNKYKGKYYTDKLQIIKFGLIGSAAAVVICAIAELIGGHGAFDAFHFVFMTVWLAGWTVGCLVFGGITVMMWYSVFTQETEKKSNLQGAIFLTVFMTPFYIIEITTLSDYLKSVSLWLFIVLLTQIIINLFSFLHLKLWTEEGRVLASKILALKNRFSMKNENEQSGLSLNAKMLDTYLPYAIALNFEKELNNAFRISNVASFTPGWFSGEVEGDFIIYYEKRMREEMRKAAFTVKITTTKE